MIQDLRLKHKLILAAILILSVLLRFWRFGDYPALNADEAAIGYNAYALLETGKDEHGNLWPIHFQSFNDYKPGLYFYLVLPFVKVLGLNEWAVRIPNAVLGVLTVYIVYFLTKDLFPKKEIGIWKLEIGHFASFLLAINPWHIHFSRGGWEVNTATFFITLGIYLFIKGQKKISLLMLSALSFVLTLYTYHAARVVVPLLVFGAFYIYRDAFKRNFKNYMFAALVGLVALLPLLKDLTKPEITSRAAGVGLFADPGPLARIDEQRGEHGNFQGFIPKVLHNKAVNYGLAFLENYSDHFHGEFLFLSGDEIQRSKVPETGQMYLFDILFLTVGFWAIIRNPKGWGLILCWLFVAPTAAALTFQSPHALRAHNMVIPLTIVSAAGLAEIIKWGRGFGKNNYFLTIYFLLLTSLIAWQFTRYLHMYYTHMAKEYPFSSQYGLKELVSFVNANEGKYQNIIVTDRYDQPYILFLFYLKYPPNNFQNFHKLTQKDKFGFSTVRNFGKFEFKSIAWDTDQPINANSLLIGTDQEIPDVANIIAEIYGANGYKYFQIVAN